MSVYPRYQRALRAIALAWAGAALGLPLTSLAWGPQGHQVVAGLAQAQLTPAARTEATRLLALEPGATLESISTWADENRSPDTGAWHYVNFPRGTCTFDAPRDCPEGRCVVQAIASQLQVLGSDAPDATRLLALKYVVHLVADVHQPLHAGHREDRGGNTYQVQALGRGTNLHALWDSGFNRHWGQPTPALVRRVLPQSRASAARRATVVEAAQESCRIVDSAGFYPASRQVGPDYLDHFSPTVEQRLALAGARLADVLNRALRAR